MADRMEPNPAFAWLQALIYFTVCAGLGAASGVWATGANNWQFARELANPAFWAFTAGCFLVVAVGYGVIWRRGTQTHGRALHVPSVLIFGGLWGLCEAQLFLAVWIGFDRQHLAPVLVGVLSFLVLGTYKGLFHALYWDVYVAPRHNIEAWNLRKVVFAHIPNLAVSLTHFALYGDVLVFVALQMLALTISTWAMRFPAPWAPRP